MKRVNNKTLLIIIGVLLVSNLALLFMYFKPGTPPPRNPGDFMIRELNLDQAQSAQFRTLFDSTKSRNKPLYDSVRFYKDQLFGYLKQPAASDSLLQSTIRRMNVFEDSTLMNNYRHFQAIRAFCNPEQQQRLDSVILRFNRRRR